LPQFHIFLQKLHFTTCNIGFEIVYFAIRNGFYSASELLRCSIKAVDFVNFVNRRKFDL